MIKKLNKRADIKYSFIVIVLILLIVIAFILINSGAFGKTGKFVSSCVSVSPAFDYECANNIKGNTVGDKPATACPSEWSVDRSKECKKQDDIEVQCCYRAR